MCFSWDVVFWYNEDATDFVPSSWANASKTMYKFPMGPRMTETRKRKMIYTCASLEEGEYTWFNATCKKSGITDIAKAKMLCELSKATSNLESAEDTSQSTDIDSIDDMGLKLQQPFSKIGTFNSRKLLDQVDTHTAGMIFNEVIHANNRVSIAFNNM